MTRLAQTAGLTETQTDIVGAVREFVDRVVIPAAQELEHSDTYPTDIVKQMKDMGLFGLTIDPEYGGIGESLLTYALVRRRIGPWMDERVRCHQHAFHRGLT